MFCEGHCRAYFKIIYYSPWFIIIHYHNVIDDFAWIYSYWFLKIWNLMLLQNYIRGSCNAEFANNMCFTYNLHQCTSSRTLTQKSLPSYQEFSNWTKKYSTPTSIHRYKNGTCYYFDNSNGTQLEQIIYNQKFWKIKNFWIKNALWGFV